MYITILYVYIYILYVYIYILYVYIYIYIYIYIYKLGFTPYKTEQPLQGMELQEKEKQD